MRNVMKSIEAEKGVVGVESCGERLIRKVKFIGDVQTVKWRHVTFRHRGFAVRSYQIGRFGHSEPVKACVCYLIVGYKPSHQ
jgi:hypothetical protein